MVVKVLIILGVVHTVDKGGDYQGIFSCFSAAYFTGSCRKEGKNQFIEAKENGRCVGVRISSVSTHEWDTR